MSSFLDESQMLPCQIMLKDIADSRRIANHFYKNNPNHKFSGLVISHLFWPKKENISFTLPDEVLRWPFFNPRWIQLFSKSYSEVKNSRNLQLIPNTGLL